MKGLLGDLPQRILASERKLADIEKQIEDAALMRDAAAFARDLFRELAREITRSFGDLLRSERPVSVETLDLGGMSATDGGGELRPVDLLSRGTRDAFLFAARLALAANSRDRDGLLILDDPFSSLDEARSDAALAFLARFRAQRQWQLIVFSKDLLIEERAERAFGDLQVIRLA